jgi:hypothetical protein
MVFRVCMNCVCEKYYHKKEKGRKEHMKPNMPQCIKTLNIFIDKLHLFFESIIVYKDPFLY